MCTFAVTCIGYIVCIVLVQSTYCFGMISAGVCLQQPRSSAAEVRQGCQSRFIQSRSRLLGFNLDIENSGLDYRLKSRLYLENFRLFQIITDKTRLFQINSTIRQLNNILQRSMIVVICSQLQTRIEQVLNQRQAHGDGELDSLHFFHFQLRLSFD